MIKSMTGYGSAQQLVAGMNITVEIKSVNHRYFEFSSKLPRTDGFLDENLKNELSLSFHPNDNHATVVISNEEFMHYLSLVGNTYEFIEMYDK